MMTKCQRRNMSKISETTDTTRSAFSREDLEKQSPKHVLYEEQLEKNAKSLSEYGQ